MPQTAAQKAVATYLRDRAARGELAPTTVRTNGEILRRFAATLGDKRVSDITTRDVERWQRNRVHILASTRRTELAVVSGWLTYEVERGRLKSNPVARIKRPKRARGVPAALPVNEVTAILDHCVSVGDRRLLAIVWCELGLGLRRSEVAALRVEDWDRRAQTIRVAGKGGHVRLLPVTESVARALGGYLSECPASSGPLFRSRRPPFEALQPKTVGWIVDRMLRDCGVKRHAWDRVCGHALRHTALSDTLDACGDLRVVMEMAGHSSLAVTSVYQRRSQVGELRAAMEQRPY